MFGFKERSYGTFEDADSLKNLNDEDLVRLYKERQQLAGLHIDHRDHPEIHDGKSEEPVSREMQELRQDLVEEDFGVLGRMRTEIKRRGLEVPTLEEQEKSKN
jgi:hypothetical protein